MVREGALGRLVPGLGWARPDPQPKWNAIISRQHRTFGHAPGRGAGDRHAQIKLLANANGRGRHLGIQGKSPDSPQEAGRTAVCRYRKNLDVKALATPRTFRDSDRN